MRLAMGGGQPALSTQELLCGASSRDMWGPTRDREHGRPADSPEVQQVIMSYY